VSKHRYTVKTEVFEGPLELLLTLIEKRKLLINDISLAAVTDDFISHINKNTSVPLLGRAHFILVASTLLLIKSKSLLPAILFTEEETESIEDLERRLRLYKLFRKQGLRIRERAGKSEMYLPEHRLSSKSIFSPHKGITLKKIAHAIQIVIQELPQRDAIPKAVVAKVISVEAIIEKLTDRIQKGLEVSFREFSGLGKDEKMQVVVSFLALLELVKQGMLSVTQDQLFEDIRMETTNVSTPRYT